MPKSYPPEFRRKVLDLVDAGRQVAQVAADLGISEQTIYVWRRQDLIDTGQLPGLDQRRATPSWPPPDKRIAELETEVAVHRRAARVAEGGGRPKRRFAAIAVMAAEGAARRRSPAGCSEVSESGYYALAQPAASARAVRHAWLTDRSAQSTPPRAAPTAPAGCTPS